MIEFQKTLVCSTSMISRATACALDGEAVATLPVHFAKGDYGWFVHVAEEIDPGYPLDLGALLVFAKSHDCHWIMFDRDGDELDGFPIYEW